MVNYSAEPMFAKTWSQPDIDIGSPRYTITVEWTWPTQAYWSRFRLVRSMRSPCVRTEEGRVVLDVDPNKHGSYNFETGRPTFEDAGREGVIHPMPGHWIYYTAFVLDANRIWRPAGTVLEHYPTNGGWSYRLPSFLPGAATSLAHGVLTPPDKQTDVVRFMQGPAFFLDYVTSIAESVQYFWDPESCPPQAVEELGRSWGYPYAGLLGMQRGRATLAAARTPSQGSLSSIYQLAQAASGTEVLVYVSNNLMLDLDDSSFESGDVMKNRWEPKANLAVLDHANNTSYPPEAPLNTKTQYYLHAKVSGKYTCGAGDPVKNGIPLSDWDNFRMGCYALAASLDPQLKLGMDVYDRYGVFVQSFTALSGVVVGSGGWDPYGFSTPQDPDGNVVPLTLSSQERMPANVLTTTSNWTPSTLAGYSIPQSTAPAAVASGMTLKWNTSPSTNTAVAFQGVDSAKFSDTISVGATYLISVSVTALAGAAAWRVAVAGSAYSDIQVVPDGTNASISFLWKATITTPHIGVEVLRPTGVWTAVGEHIVTAISVVRQTAEIIYGVPWFDVKQPCYLDLIVVDDGR